MVEVVESYSTPTNSLEHPVIKKEPIAIKMDPTLEVFKQAVL